MSRKNFPGDKRSCPRCGQPIVVTEKMCRDRTYQCSPCRSSYGVKTAKKNIDKHRAHIRAHYYKNKERYNQASREYRKRNPEKVHARSLVSAAIRRGKLTKGPCEVCGTAKVTAHHDDYSKPLDVRWFCHIHHEELHHGK